MDIPREMSTTCNVLGLDKIHASLDDNVSENEWQVWEAPKFVALRVPNNMTTLNKNLHNLPF